MLRHHKKPPVHLHMSVSVQLLSQQPAEAQRVQTLFMMQFHASHMQPSPPSPGQWQLERPL